MVAQVAADEPEMAAKMVQPTTLVCKSRPGSLSIHGARPRNMLSESLLRNRISPIHKNSGSAVSVQAELAPQIVSIMLSPTGRLVNSSIPTSPTASRPRPIHMPAPSTAKSAMISTNAAIMSMLFSQAYSATDPGPAMNHSRTRQRATIASRKASAKATQPIAMLSCGIHSGVASAAGETSCVM